jgi:hypothetical protein
MEDMVRRENGLLVGQSWHYFEGAEENITNPQASGPRFELGISQNTKQAL